VRENRRLAQLEAARKVEEAAKETARRKAIEEAKPEPSRANDNKIRLRMSLAEVQAVLGPGKESASAPGIQTVTWQSDELFEPTIISVTVENNRVAAGRGEPEGEQD
jgi:hypothetical protein